MRCLLIAIWIVLVLINGSLVRGFGFDETRPQDWILLVLSTAWLIIGAWKKD